MYLCELLFVFAGGSSLGEVVGPANVGVYGGSGQKPVTSSGQKALNKPQYRLKAI